MCPFALVLYVVGLLQLASGLSQAALHHQFSSRLGAALACPAGTVSSTASLVRFGQRTSSVQCVATNSEVVQAQAIAEAPQQQQQKKQKDNKKKGSPALGKPVVIGLSHKTATVEVREKLSIPESQWNEASVALTSYDSIGEAAVLSTCNRFELYIVAEDHYAATRDAMAFLREHSGLEDSELRPNLFVL